MPTALPIDRGQDHLRGFLVDLAARLSPGDQALAVEALEAHPEPRRRATNPTGPAQDMEALSWILWANAAMADRFGRDMPGDLGKRLARGAAERVAEIVEQFGGNHTRR